MSSDAFTAFDYASCRLLGTSSRPFPRCKGNKFPSPRLWSLRPLRVKCKVIISDLAKTRPGFEDSVEGSSFTAFYDFTIKKNNNFKRKRE